MINETKNDDMDKKVIDTAIARVRGIIGNGLDDPKTIQEKILWLNCYEMDNIDIKTKCCDKLGLREYCKEKIGKDLCPKVLKVYNNADEIKISELPDKFVLKCNHGSGFNVIVNNKSKVNDVSIKTKFKGWLSKNYCTSYWYELCYYGVKPKVFAEEYVGDNICDYKFWCFNGKPGFIFVSGNRFTNLYYNFYDLDFNRLSIEQKDHKQNPKLDKKPNHLSEMIEYAKVLSKDFTFARIDFYEIGDRVYLSEITFVPSAGNLKYTNPDDGIKIGNMLDLSKLMPNKKTNVSVSFVKPTETSTISPNPQKKNKNVVYMAIVGGVDKIVKPQFRSNGFDYVCYTDKPEQKVDGWEIRPIPDKLKDLPKAKQNRYIKTHPHEFFPDYDFSIYIDGNVDLLADLNDFMKKYGIDKKNGSIFIGQHPSRNCLYQERDVVVKMKKDTKENTEAMMKKYKDEGFPKNYGLSQNCMMFRFHNDPGCIKVMETWWEQIKNYSHRDQLSLFYSFWKHQEVKPVILNKEIFKGKYLSWRAVHRK